MRTYAAVTGKLIHVGSLSACARWALEQVEGNQSRVVKLMKMHASDRRATIIGEASTDGLRWISGGRTVDLRRIKRATRHG